MSYLFGWFLMVNVLSAFLMLPVSLRHFSMAFTYLWHRQHFFHINVSAILFFNFRDIPPPLDTMRAVVIVWRISGKIIRTVRLCGRGPQLYTVISTHPHISSSCRGTRACRFRFSLGFCVFFWPISSVFVLFVFFVFWCIFPCLFWVVSTSASDCLERLVSEMTCYV